MNYTECQECINYCPKSSGFGYCGLHNIETYPVSLCDQFDVPVKFKVVAQLPTGKFTDYGTYLFRGAAEGVCTTLQSQGARFLNVSIEEV